MKVLGIWLLVAPWLFMWRGYVLCVLWAWFLVPSFGVRPLSLPEAIGLILVATFLVARLGAKEGDEVGEDEIWLWMFKAFMFGLITLGVAWPVTWFM